jgi:hypothetical protein
MKVNNLSPANLKVAALLCIAGLILAGFTQAFGRSSTSRLEGRPLQLDVPVLKQSWSTSCGEAVIAMTYNHAHPDTPVREQEVIEFAKESGYYTEDKAPFTSPASMVKIAEYYADDISTGNVTSSRQGLALLVQKLRDGQPVIIDVLSNFSDPDSEAHFVVVTGLSVDTDRGNSVIVHYNDPLTGTKETSEWAGSQGLWNAWQTNGDPGGAGWWLVIPSQADMST